MSWYKCFYKIGLPASEQLLMMSGKDGSFLVRPSSSSPGQKTLSYRDGNEVSHIKIMWNGDSYEFSDSVGEGFETFATIDDLIEYYLENRIHLRNGHEVVLRSPLRVLRLDSQPPSSELWYHGTLLGSDAEQLVKEAQNSSFLVRESRTSLGNYALTVKVNDRVKHLKIYAEGNPRRFHLENDQQEFDCLESLVRHYRGGLVDSQSEYICTRHPVNRSSIPANDLERWLIRNQERHGHEIEWEELTHNETRMRLRENITVARKPENIPKNRYKNILPYDSYRVKLDRRSSDYINASRVSHFDEEIGKQKGKSYISTQGPLPNTVEDFWFMVMQEKSCAILMIAKEIEKERKKCERYWPDKVNETKVWGSAKVTLLSAHQPDPAFWERLIRLEIQGKVHHVVQFQFVLWPDFSTPEDRDIEQVLHYLERVKALTIQGHYNGVPLNTRAPTVVHCSAGIGRSGAVMVIDMISDQLEFYQGDITIDIKKTVIHCREHRHSMVQTIEQYKFIAKTIARKTREITRR